MDKRIQLEMGDITRLQVDVIVNAANRALGGGGGVDGAIHRAAGPELVKVSRPLAPCEVGEAKITPGFNLLARYVVHTVGPVWYGGDRGEAAALAACYGNSLQLAVDNGAKTIAFPAISTGAFGYPALAAAKVALESIQAFLAGDKQLERVVLVSFDRAMQKKYEYLLRDERPYDTTLILCDVQKEVVTAWQGAFEGVERVEIAHGSIFDVACDALVSPANSYGFMDGGLDMAISRYFGWHVQDRLQKMIRSKHHGELLVGAAEIVPTDHDEIPFVISAPTMRVPMILYRTSVAVYLATRAVLLLVEHGRLANGRPVKDVVKRVAISGMGTGVGHFPAELCARQMRQAVDDVLLGGYRFPQNWHDAQTRHQLLYDDNTRDLQYRKS